MIDKEILITYVKLWEFSEKNKNVKYTSEQLNLIKYVNLVAKKDEILNKLLKSLINKDNKISIIEQYYLEKENKQDVFLEKIEDSYNESKQDMTLQNKYEEKVVESASSLVELDFDYLSSDLQERIIAFYENPELLDLLSNEEKEKWNKYIEIYKKKLEQENNTRSKPKIKQLTNEEGFISSIEFLLLICVLVTITISVIICVNL